MFIIYMLTSPSGTRYIGQTSYPIHVRIQKHKSAAKCHKGKGCRYLNNAIRKYGIESFKIEILVECNIDQVDYFEKKFIKVYNTLDPDGYNLMDGGNSNKTMSDNTKLLMRQRALERDTTVYRKSEETKELPRYLIRIDNEYQKGYKISKHPKCLCKYFADPKKTRDDNLKEALDCLDKLNKGELEIPKFERKLPDGIQKMGKGYRIRILKKDGTIFSKNFGSTKYTSEELLGQATKFLNSLEL